MQPAPAAVIWQQKDCTECTGYNGYSPAQPSAPLPIHPPKLLVHRQHAHVQHVWVGNEQLGAVPQGAPAAAVPCSTSSSAQAPLMARGAGGDWPRCLQLQEYLIQLLPLPLPLLLLRLLLLPAPLTSQPWVYPHRRRRWQGHPPAQTPRRTAPAAPAAGPGRGPLWET